MGVRSNWPVHSWARSSRRHLSIPTWRCLFQDSEGHAESGSRVTEIGEQELGAVRQYLLGGGFLFIEGDRHYLKEMMMYVAKGAGRTY